MTGAVAPLTLGVMQGRLSPSVEGRIQAFPWDTWEQEFQVAPSANVQLIEWIVDAAGFEENPLITPGGRARIRGLERETGTRVRTVCADCFMAWPFSTPDRSLRRHHLERLLRIIAASAELGVFAITIPFVDESAIRSAEEGEAVVAAIGDVLPSAADAGVSLALETSLPPAAFRSLLSEIDGEGTSGVAVNYDSGNSASLGYDVAEEFAAYGPRVAVIHVKDRVRGGGTVPLGEGDADFPRLFEVVRASKYTGPLILQAARGRDDVATVKEYASFVERHLRSGAAVRA